MTTTSTTNLETPYVLPDDSPARFNEQGFIELADVLGPEVISVYEPEITSKVIELNTMQLPMEERSTYNKAFLQVANLWKRSELIKELVFSARLAKIAADLLGVDGVRLYHDQALYKEAGGGITPWHADQYYWPLSTDRCCTIWLPLQETPKEMGPLTFAAGSQHFEFGRDLPISDESEAALQKALAEQEFPIVEEPFHLGDASYHLGWTFHHASPNTMPEPRRVMTIIYIDADMVISEPVNDPQRSDLATWLGGAKPGGVANGPDNPVLYRASAAH